MRRERDVVLGCLSPKVWRLTATDDRITAPHEPSVLPEVVMRMPLSGLIGVVKGRASFRGLHEEHTHISEVSRRARCMDALGKIRKPPQHLVAR